MAHVYSHAPVVRPSSAKHRPPVAGQGVERQPRSEAAAVREASDELDAFERQEAEVAFGLWVLTILVGARSERRGGGVAASRRRGATAPWRRGGGVAAAS